MEDVFGRESYELMKARLKARVSPKRYKHSKGVAKAARKLAKVYGYNPDVARMAGILHDWDKGLDHEQIRERVRELGMQVDPFIVDEMPWVLHGPTAASALKRDYPWLGEEVCRAIERHTSGAADMAPLDCIIFVADIIEPNRTFADKEGVERLRALVGKIPLEELYFQAYKYTLQFLIDRDRQIAPGTLETWNALIPKFGFMRVFK